MDPILKIEKMDSSLDNLALPYVLSMTRSEKSVDIAVFVYQAVFMGLYIRPIKKFCNSNVQAWLIIDQIFLKILEENIFNGKKRNNYHILINLAI